MARAASFKINTILIFVAAARNSIAKIYFLLAWLSFFPFKKFFLVP